MGAKKIYKEADYYEKKLDRVMERFGVEKYNWDFNRRECWVEFFYKGGFYRFEYSVQQAQDAGFKLQYGSDAFAQLVLALEDLARLVERNIYDLSFWIAGMKALPAGTTVEKTIPDCFRQLGFTEWPKSKEEVKRAYRELVKTAHPDNGGSAEAFQKLVDAFEQAMQHMG